MAVEHLADAAEEDQQLEQHYEDPGVDYLYSRIWGEDIHYGIYADETESIEAATRRAKLVMAEPLPLAPEFEVLEVGCGYGSTARFLAERFGCRVVATNISQAQLARAEQLTSGTPAAGRVSFAIADYHDLPYEHGSFDCWWCQESLVHSDDKPRVLAEAYRILKPGGYAVVSDQIFRPDRLQPPELEAVRDRYHTETVAGPAQYAAMIQAAGFELIEQRDWQQHAVIHRRKIYDRLQELMPELRVEVASETLERTCMTWSAWAKLAEEGKLGFHYYLARKP